jgi:hypothetical protein
MILSFEYKFTDQNISDLNKLSEFFSLRDLMGLKKDCLYQKYNLKKIDLIILLGNADFNSSELATEAMVEFSSETLLISGGIGHSTRFLTENIRKNNKLRTLKTDGMSEAEMLSGLMLEKSVIPKEKITLEKKSTNCGSNAFESLKIVKEKHIKHDSVLIIQDSSMQRRSYASFKKEWGQENSKLISFSAQIPKIIRNNGDICFDSNIYPWTLERYISLCLGEIPRLRDDSNGYGPKGKNYIIHMEITNEVEKAYQRLLNDLPSEFLNR